MRINEVEQQAGITKKNIRFYEQQGLLSPKRNLENGYRNYTQEDVLTLKKIRLLRKLSLPIEEIRHIQNGDLILEDALQRQIIVLEREKAGLEEAARLCRVLQENQCRYNTFSPDIYLERLTKMEQEGTKFPNVNRRDIVHRKMASVMTGLLFILIMIGTMAAMIWGYQQEPLPLWLIGFLMLIPAALIAATVVVLWQRMKEIEGGEEDAARKY